MFESAELGHRIADREYDREEPKLRAALLKAQYDLLGNKTFPVIIIIGGVDGAGKGTRRNTTAARFTRCMERRTGKGFAGKGRL